LQDTVADTGSSVPARSSQGWAFGFISKKMGFLAFLVHFPYFEEIKVAL
jgi:hypothetical protein